MLRLQFRSGPRTKPSRRFLPAAVVGQDTARRSEGGAPCAGTRGCSRHLAVHRVAEIEALAAVTPGIEHGVGANGNGQRLLGRLWSIGLALASQDTSDVHLQRKVRDLSPASRAKRDHARADRRQVGIADIGSRLPGRARINRGARNRHPQHQSPFPG